MAAIEFVADNGDKMCVERRADEVYFVLNMADGFAVMSASITLREAADLACYLAVAVTGQGGN